MCITDTNISTSSASRPNSPTRGNLVLCYAIPVTFLAQGKKESL